MGLLSELRSPTGKSWQKTNAFDDLQIIFKNPDPKKGIVLEQESILRLDLLESIFSMLPIAKIILKDSGRFFSTYHITNGDVFYLKMTPNKETIGEDVEIIPFIDSQFVVQSITKVPNIDKQNFSYEITGIYNAENLLNEIYVFPNESNTNFSLVKGLNELAKAHFSDYSLPLLPTFRSEEVLRETINGTGLKFIPQVKGNDSSFWLNSHESRSKFINRIIEHAWIEEEDAPLLYTDINGCCYYTSIKTMLSNSATISSDKMGTSKSMKFRDFNVDIKKPLQDEIYYRFLGKLNIFNASGPILNKGGYKIKSYFYNPYKNNLINDTEKIKNFVNNNFSNTRLNSMSVDPYEGYKTYESSQDKSFLGVFNYKKPSNLNTVSKINNGGIKFSDLHEHYDIAKEHNEMIRRSFFQTFVEMSVDTLKQPKEFSYSENRPKIGSLVFLDLGGTDVTDVIHTGNYIVAQIKHVYQPGFSYTLGISLVSDGFYSEGEK